MTVSFRVCGIVAIGLYCAAPAPAPIAGLSLTAQQLNTNQKFSAKMLQDDTAVLGSYKDKLLPQVKGIDADHALTDAWFHIRTDTKPDSTVGLTINDLFTYYQYNVPVVVDSSPRLAAVEVRQGTGDPERKKTRDTFNLRTGTTYKVRFTLNGYQTREEDLTVTSDTSFFCRELQSLTGQQVGKCPLQ